MKGIHMFQAIGKGVSHATDYIEHGTYTMANTVGSTMQVISGIFLANTGIKYASQQQGYFWSNTKEPLPAPVETWIAYPFTALHSYTTVDPTALALGVFAIGSVLKLMGRSSVEARSIKKASAAILERADAIRSERYAISERTDKIKAETKATENYIDTLKSLTQIRKENATAIQTEFTNMRALQALLDKKKDN